MKHIRFGVIGVSGRGHSVMKDVILNLDDVSVTAVCDLYQDRCERAVNTVKEISGKEPFSTTDYKEVIASGLCDAIYIATAWESHIEKDLRADQNSVYAYGKLLL